ncbi:MAG: hypothetical protein AAF495_11700 [Pseudomonadota bacterium]
MANQDFRRTLSGKLSAMPYTAQIVVSGVLIQVENGGIKTKDRCSYDSEEVSALERWSVIIWGKP